MERAGEMIPDKESALYLQSLPAIRDRCQQVFDAVEEGRSENFVLHLDRLGLASEMVIRLISRDYGQLDSPAAIQGTLAKIPPHGRWRHFGAEADRLVEGRIKEQALKSLLDLLVVAVLLDAGAGDTWIYVDHKQSNRQFSRSEGLAMASLRMFEQGLFSNNPATDPLRVDADALGNLLLEQLAQGMQVSHSNPLAGLEGRRNLLVRLGRALKEQATYFPPSQEGEHRPSNLINHLQANIDMSGGHPPKAISVERLWTAIMKGFGPIWPSSRTKLHGESLGDVWSCQLVGHKLVPFHKLSQWLTYSLLEPLEKLGGLQFVGVEECMTGLAEYRNGGLFIDLGILEIKSPVVDRSRSKERCAPDAVPLLDPADQAIIEWRALTIILVDRVAADIRARLKTSASELSLAKILEAGTWKAGREIAKDLRSATGGGPPLAILSDGTLF